MQILACNLKVCFCHSNKASIIVEKGNTRFDMAKEKTSIKRKLVKAGGWQLAKRAAKSIPPFGTVLAIGFVGYDIKKKGVVRGVINSGLDAIPLIGTGKNIIELFTGDFLPDKKAETDGNKLPEKKKE